MEVTWLAGRIIGGIHKRWGRTHLLLQDNGKLLGPFCITWDYEDWEEDPYPLMCKWCLKAERWIRLVEGEPLDVLKRIPGYVPTVRKHALREDSQ